MATEKTPDRELSSWKEIASYLQVGVRTAQVWEQERGLPVRRLPGSRGRVLTTVAELEIWKRSSEAIPPSTVVPTPALPAVEPGNPRRVRHFLLSAAAVCLTVAVFALAALWFLRPHAPAGFRIAQNTLIVVDAAGRECWRKIYPFPLPEIDSEGRLIWIGDLDGDGETELLFSPSAPPMRGTEVICYAQNGRERWRFVPGKIVRTSSETFSPPYRVQAFAVVPGGPAGPPGVVVVSQHHLYFPVEVAFLSADGRLLREYWHSGGMGSIVVDGDRILTGGVNNATKSGALLVLDPHTMRGASVEENPAYQLQDFAPGVEIARLLFPRSCINRLLEPMASVVGVWKMADEIVVEVRHRPGNYDASIYYHLNPDLSLKSMSVGSSFERSHEQLFATHVLDHALQPAEIRSFRDVRYLTGTPSVLTLSSNSK
ncbi:MAG TPA: hypothetical protein VKU19_00615 [Bryobacteraceae bacterium]|nr:hypothetical protein [Bryobacteraceae bacterium]